MATNVYVPDQTNPVPLPKDGVTVEEARRLLAQVGYAGLENARGTVLADGSIKFERPVGGEKGR
jgi:hypothetical protein